MTYDVRTRWIDLEAEGVVGNGTTNDHDIVQGAFADLPARGGVVVVPADALILLDQMVDITKNNIKVIGLGSSNGYFSANGPTFLCDTPGVTMMRWYAGDLVHNGPVFEDINWQTRAANITCLEMRAVNHWSLNRCNMFLNGEGANGGTGLWAARHLLPEDGGTDLDCAWWQLNQCHIGNAAYGIRDEGGGAINDGKLFGNGVSIWHDRGGGGMRMKGTQIDMGGGSSIGVLDEGRQNHCLEMSFQSTTPGATTCAIKLNVPAGSPPYYGNGSSVGFCDFGNPEVAKPIWITGPGVIKTYLDCNSFLATGTPEIRDDGRGLRSSPTLDPVITNWDHRQLNSYEKMRPQTATPPTPANGDCHRYMRGSKFVLQYKDGGTVRYKYLDLAGSGTAWVHSTSAP